MDSRKSKEKYHVWLTQKPTYVMPQVCVNCGRPANSDETYEAWHSRQQGKVIHTLSLKFPLCVDCGEALKAYRRTDKISSNVVAIIAGIPALVMLIVGIVEKSPAPVVIFAPLLTFIVIYFVLILFAKPIARLFIKPEFRKCRKDINKSVALAPFVGMMTVEFIFARQDFAELFQSLNKV